MNVFKQQLDIQNIQNIQNLDNRGWRVTGLISFNFNECKTFLMTSTILIHYLILYNSLYSYFTCRQLKYNLYEQVHCWVSFIIFRNKTVRIQVYLNLNVLPKTGVICLHMVDVFTRKLVWSWTGLNRFSSFFVDLQA